MQRTKNILKITFYITVLALLVISLIHYSVVYDSSFPEINKFLEEPERFDGLTKQTMGPFAGYTTDGFLIEYNKRLIPVYYDQEYVAPRFGEVIVYGIFHREGYIEAIGVHNYDYNYVIYLISFITIIFVIILFFSEWKITLRGFKSA